VNEFSPSTLRTKRVSCWNCRRIVIVPLAIDPETMMNDNPSYIIPYGMKCPGCGDEIYKYKCRDESNFVH